MVAKRVQHPLKPSDGLSAASFSSKSAASDNPSSLKRYNNNKQQRGASQRSKAVAEGELALQEAAQLKARRILSTADDATARTKQ